MHTFDTRSAFERLLAYHLGDGKAKECADALLDRYGSLSTVCTESEDALCRVGGVNMNTALLIKLIAYINSRRVSEKIELGRVYTELEMREYIGALFMGSSVESVYAVLLDDKGRTVAVEHINDGVVNASDVLPRKILECAKKHKSSRIILAHNHPRGSASPSKDDIATTTRLVNMFAGFGVCLCAHYIVGDADVKKIDAEMFRSIGEY